MKQFYVGTLVAYEREKKEWLITKAELVSGEHTNNVVMYTIEKVDGREVGKKLEVTGDVLDL